ncbi:MAG: hypothetical protein A2Y88_05690 [Chloroflexi bacterium RBG_13_48_10]|nr:MAG: hypothetical protein A2Y88_05690 [Chloroflexi bacterium RBG_13_48_10]
MDLHEQDNKDTIKAFRITSGQPCKTGRKGQHKGFPPHKSHPIRHRPIHCDCGQLAVTVVSVTVGTDPQYTIRLPLCRECLALERDMNKDQ